MTMVTTDELCICRFVGCDTPVAFRLRYLTKRFGCHDASDQKSLLLCLEHTMLVRRRLMDAPADYLVVDVCTMDGGDDFRIRAAAARAARRADRLMAHLDEARVATNKARRLAKDTHPAFLSRVRELCLEQRLQRLAEIGWEMP